MDLTDRKKRGRALIEKMLGIEGAEEVRRHWRDISPEFEGYVEEFLAGEIWSRGQLDLRTKSLITIAAMAAIRADHLDDDDTVYVTDVMLRKWARGLALRELSYMEKIVLATVLLNLADIASRCRWRFRRFRRFRGFRVSVVSE